MQEQMRLLVEQSTSKGKTKPKLRKEKKKPKLEPGAPALVGVGSASSSTLMGAMNAKGPKKTGKPLATTPGQAKKPRAPRVNKKKNANQGPNAGPLGKF